MNMGFLHNYSLPPTLFHTEHYLSMLGEASDMAPRPVVDPNIRGPLVKVCPFNR